MFCHDANTKSGSISKQIDSWGNIRGRQFPIESAFTAKDGPSWRASRSGEQQIRIVFDEPVSLHRRELRFDERDCERTREFILRCSSAWKCQNSRQFATHSC